MLKQIVLFAACCLILAALVAVANTDLNFFIVIPALFIAGYLGYLVARTITPP
jgi:hypothetical protein